MREITHLVVHCSATPEGRDIGAKTIRQWHLDKGWRDIGYHFVIRLDGTIETGRNIAVAGSHVAGHNANTIGICMVGGMDAANKNPKNTFTPSQFESLHNLLHDLKEQFPKAAVLGHRDFPNVHKACPSFDVREWWNGGHGVKGNRL